MAILSCFPLSLVCDVFQRWDMIWMHRRPSWACPAATDYMVAVGRRLKAVPALPLWTRVCLPLWSEILLSILRI